MKSSRERVVLFVCVENRFRSQIAEAYFNANPPSGWRAISAGSEPAEEVHPNAVKLMQEEGLDISRKKPKPLTRELERIADVGVIVCGESGSKKCPVLFTRYVEQWSIPDPAGMSIEEARRIRDEIKRRVMDLVERIARGDIPPKGKLGGIKLTLNQLRQP